MKRLLIGLAAAILLVGVCDAGYSSRSYSGGSSYSGSRSYSTPSYSSSNSRSYSAPKSYSSPSYGAPKSTYSSPAYKAPTKTYSSPAYSQSKTYGTPSPSISRPLNNTIVQHHYYSSGPSFGGGNFWFWMWMINSQQGGHGYAAAPSGGTGTGATNGWQDTQTSGWEQFLVVLLNGIILLALGAGVWWFFWGRKRII